MRQYKDIYGNPIELNKLCRLEPDWAVNQIRHRDKLEKEYEILKEAFLIAAKENGADGEWTGFMETPEEEWVQKYIDVVEKKTNLVIK